MTQFKRGLRVAYLRWLISIYYRDPRASRALLAGAAMAWAAWLFTPGNSLAGSTSLRVIAELMKSETLVAAIPFSIGMFQIIVAFQKTNCYRFYADFAAAAWWSFVTITYFLSNAFAPSIGVYGMMTMFSFWIVWRDTNPKSDDKTLTDNE